MKIIDSILNILYPHKCLLCKKYNETYGLCSECWKNLTFITDPSCNICSQPFEYDTRKDMICGHCLMNKPFFDRSISALHYDDVSKKLIHKFKFEDNMQIGKLLANILIQKLAISNLKIDYIAPVPLHKIKLLKRQFNQSAILSNYITKKLKIASLNQLIIKHKYTSSQTFLPKIFRKTNIKDSFKINEKFIPIIKGKNILIIDDVFTTGSTFTECSKILKKAGAKQVYTASICKNIL